MDADGKENKVYLNWNSNSNLGKQEDVESEEINVT